MQFTGKDGGLVATGAGTHLQEDVLVVARILRQQQQAQRFVFREQVLLQAADLLVPQLAHARIGVGLQFARRREFALKSVVTGEAFRQRLQARVFHRQFAELLRAAGHFIGGEQPSDFLEAVGEFLQALSDGFLHGCKRGRILRDVRTL